MKLPTLGYCSLILRLIWVTGDAAIARNFIGREFRVEVTGNSPTTVEEVHNFRLLAIKTCVDEDGNKYPCPRPSINLQLIPHLISPRDTALLNVQPTLRWNALPGATRYTVKVRREDEGEVIWETQVSTSEVVYAGEALKPGIDYLLIVEADKGRSSEEESLPGRGFRLLEAPVALRVREEIEQLRQQGMTEKEEALAVAELYSKSKLRAEAIETLERLIAGGIEDAEVYRRLGDYYRRVGVLLVAEGRYLKAVELAGGGEREEEAAAKAGLGAVYTRLGNNEKAVRWLTEARDIYIELRDNTDLKDGQRVQQLERRIQQLEEQLKQLNS